VIGLFQQPCLEQWKDNFPIFAGAIEHKLGEEAYGSLQFNLELLDWLHQTSWAKNPHRCFSKWYYWICLWTNIR
jgi:hypothetical protein